MKKMIMLMLLSLLSLNVFADACKGDAYGLAKAIVKLTDGATNGLSLDKEPVKASNQYFFKVWEDYNSDDFELMIEMVSSDSMRACVPIRFEWIVSPL